MVSAGFPSKHTQIPFLVQGMGKCFLYFDAFGYPVWILFQVRKESIHQWFYHQLTPGSPFVWWKTGKLSFLPVDRTDLVHDEVQNRLFPQIFRYDFQCLMELAPAMSDGKSYRCHHGDYNEQVPLVFADTLTGYLQECIDNGNKPATICKKERTCIVFLVCKRAL